MNMLSQKLLEQKRKKVKRKVITVNLSQAKSALLVYNASDEILRKEIIDFARFLKEEGVKTDSLGLFKKKGKEDSLPEDEFGHVYFDKKSTDLLGFPKDQKINKIIATEYHLMIDINLKNNFTLQVISSLSRANFKVGKAGGYRDAICDLTIDSEDGNYKELIEQVKKYLQMINKK